MKTGTTFTLISSNAANLADNGSIIYTESQITGDVEIHINKLGGTEETMAISVTIPASKSAAANSVNVICNCAFK